VPEHPLPTALPLEGVRVLDLSTVVAGPVIARNLGDFGAEVLKIEHPEHGDPSRALGYKVDGESLWWKTVNRNKLPITLNLGDPRGADLARALAARSDVLVESFRPGTLERWGLAPDALLEQNPGLVIVRVSGFGQTGPYAGRPGFGTLAESLSGFAGAHGEEGGPPQLPAIALADESAGVWGTMAALIALFHRERTGQGQIVDVSLHEPLFAMLGPLPALYDLTGREAARLGNRMPFTAPRGAYRTSDGKWLGLSGTSPAVAHRILAAIGHAELADDPRFATNDARLEHAEELDALIAEWVGRHTLDEALATFEAADAAAAPVYRMADVFTDPHFAARGTIARVPDEDLGAVAMADVVPRLSATPGRIRWTGQEKGAANEDVYRGLLGLGADELAELRADGVV
jgi:crotonobetainyl-CoA:carnitine CoA-transferase CaiB-like acyl-CoA transferase